MNAIPTALLQGIISGKAVLFTGAGFSRECENISSSAIIAAEDLSEKICSLGGFTDSKNLKYSSDRYISAKPENVSKLVDFLKKNYTTKSVKPYIDKITNFKWKYIYIQRTMMMSLRCHQNATELRLFQLIWIKILMI